MLRILGGVTIEEVVAYAARRLPSESARGAAEEKQTAAVSSFGSSLESSTPASTPQHSTFAKFTPEDGTDTSSLGPSPRREPSNPPMPFPSESRISPPAEKLQTMKRIVPMSFVQSRFWFMSRLVADPTAFNVTRSHAPCFSPGRSRFRTWLEPSVI